MKSIFSYILATCVCIAPTSGYAQECDQDCNKALGPFVLTKEDFCQNGEHSNSIVIKKPGNYCLGENINWCPKKCKKTAIIIDASNVTLDLSGHELKQINSHGKCSGILVKSGHDTVKIVNGAVRDFTQLGIVVEGDNSNIFLGSDDTVLKVTGCGYGSSFSFLDDVDDEPILQGGIRLGETKALEAQGYYTWKGNINTANLRNVFAEENGPVGLYLGTGSQIISQNCYFSRNADTRVAGNPNPIASGIANENWSLAFGAFYTANKDYGDNDSTTIEFLNCHFDANEIVGEVQWCSGLLMAYNINGLTFRGCSFNSNSGTGSAGEDGFGISGVVLGGCRAVLYEDCKANTNHSEFGRAEGFHHSGTNPVFENIIRGQGIVYRSCEANGNTSTGGVFPRAIGFDLFYMNSITVEDCIALNNLALSDDPTAFGYSDGLILTGAFGGPGGPVSNGVISGCHFASNQTNFTGGDVEGMYIQTPLSNLVIKNCVIQDNTGADFNSGIWIAGAADGEMFGVVIEDCVIEDQSLGIYSNADTNSIYQNNTITNVDFAVLLDGSSCDSINNNYVTNATYGFVDFANPSTSLFSNNKVFGAAVPYDVTYTFGPVPVVSGSLVTGFPAGAEVLDNVFMDNPTCTAQPVAAAAKAKGVLKTKAHTARQSRQKYMDAFVSK